MTFLCHRFPISYEIGLQRAQTSMNVWNNWNMMKSWPLLFLVSTLKAQQWLIRRTFFVFRQRTISTITQSSCQSRSTFRWSIWSTTSSKIWSKLDWSSVKIAWRRRRSKAKPEKLTRTWRYHWRCRTSQAQFSSWFSVIFYPEWFSSANNMFTQKCESVEDTQNSLFFSIEC